MLIGACLWWCWLMFSPQPVCCSCMNRAADCLLLIGRLSRRSSSCCSVCLSKAGCALLGTSVAGMGLGTQRQCCISWVHFCIWPGPHQPGQHRSAAPVLPCLHASCLPLGSALLAWDHVMATRPVAVLHTLGLVASNPGAGPLVGVRKSNRGPFGDGAMDPSHS
jgi:hypothetical protein